MRRLRLGMAQINTTVGDFKGNIKKILKAIADGSALGVDLITFSELALCDHPLLALSPFSLYLGMI